MYMIFDDEYKRKAVQWKRDFWVASALIISILSRHLLDRKITMHFQHITYLDKHLKSVASHAGKQQLFVVGGAVRDLLLGINAEPKDIDLTLMADPEVLYRDLQILSRDDYSLFRTEKYGTVTLIEKSEEITFEFTPFREE